VQPWLYISIESARKKI